MAEFDRTSRDRAARHMSLTDNREARSSRMEELAREMARRQAEAEQRRREEEERRRQQEAERQRREAEQRADEQQRQQEAESRMRLLEAQKQNERAQRERGALVLSSLNNRDHENYQRALENDQMLQQTTWERDWAIRNGDTQEAERTNAWINDRKNLIRQNTIPATRSVKTLAEYQDEWNADRPQKSAIELAIEQRQAQKKERSQEGLSQYTAAQSSMKQAQADKDAAANEQTQLKMSGEEQEVYTYAAGIAKRFGYSDDQIPATLEELADLDPAIGQDDVVRNYLTYKGHVQGKVDDAEQRIQDSDQEMRTLLHGDQVSAEDWDDLQKYNNDTWNGKVFSPFAMTEEEIQADYDGASAGIRQGGYNDPQHDTARQMVRETGRRLKILEDPKKALAELDNYIAFYEGLSGGHWDDMTDETNSRLKAEKAQRVLLEAYTLDQEPDWHQGRIEAGRQDWLNAEGRSSGDRNIGLHGSDKENRYKHTDVTALSNPFWDDLSDEGDRVLYMNDRERETFFYLYSKSPEKAREFMDALDDEYHDRRTEKQTEIFQQEADRTPVLSNFTASGLEITKGATAMVSLVDNLILGNKYHKDSIANYADTYQRVVRDRSKENLTKWAEEKGINPTLVTGAFDVATSIGDNLMRAYGTAGMGITNSAVTTGIMSLGAAGSTMRDLMAEGVDPQRAALVGGVAGIAEYVTEKWSDAKLFEVMDDGWIGLKNGIKSAAESAFMEGWTEEASNLLQLAGEAVILQGEDSFNKKVKDYYYYTGSMEEARKLAVQDMIGEGIYTMVVSGLSGAGMDIGGRTISGVWNHYTKAKQKELSGEGDSIQADQAKDSYGTQDGAEAAAEGAMPQYSSEELDEALMAAAAPMTAQEQQTDDLLNGAQEADAVTAEADAQRMAEAATVPAALRNDNVSRLAREIAAGEVQQGVEDMPVERRTAEDVPGLTDYDIEQNQTPEQVDRYIEAIGQLSEEGQVPSEWARQKIASLNTYRAMLEDRAAGVEEMPAERRTEGPAGEYRQNGRVPAGVQTQQAEESVAGVEDMPVERREETPDVAHRAAQLPHQGDGLKQIAANDRTKTVLAAWGLNDPDVEMDDDQAAKETWLAGIKGLMHEDNSDGIQDDNDWHDVAGSVWDEMMDQYGAELADRRNKLSLSLSKGAGILNEDGTVDGFSRINDPNMGLLQPAELAGIAGAVRDEYVRQQSVKAAAAARAANKYDFKAAAWDEDVEGAGRGVTLKTVDGELTAGQVTQLRLLDRFSRQLTAEGMPGMDIVVYDTIKRRGVKLNGSYDTKGGVKKAAIVNVALDAEGGNILRAAGHEMYHMIEQWGSNQAAKIKDFVLKTLERSQGYDLEGRREELREIYGEDADVDSEIVADSMFDVLNDEDRVSEVLKENRTLGDKIKDFTTRIFNALKAAGKKIAGMGSKEARALVDQTDTLDTIRGMFEEGVRTAQSNIMAARAAAGSEYNIDAVENAGTAQQRDNAITALVRKMVLNTQDETADANALQIQDLTGRMKNALMRFARGGASLNAALEEQGLKPFTGEQERGVAAWLGRELIDRTEQTKKQAGGAVIGTAETVNEDEGTRESRVLYDDLGNPYYSTDAEQNWLMGTLRTAKAQVGTWQRNLDALVERLTGTGSAKPGRIRQMLTNLYTAMDNAYKTGKGYENIMPYAKRIAETLGNKSDWRANAETDIAEYETEAYETLKGTVVNLSDVLQPSQKQWKKNGELYRKTKYDWGDVATYGTSATELNRNYGNVLRFKVDSKSANKGVSPSTILEENPSLALLVGYKSDEDNGNEANLLGRILDWIGNYERRAGIARGYYSNQVSTEAEDLILHYYDDQNSPEVQRLLEGMKGYRGMRDTEEQAIAAEVDILKQLTAVQADVINDLGTDVQRANRLKELADKRADRIQERFNVEKARRAIQKELTTMRQWLFEPTKADGRHVSDRFRSGIAAALQMVDTRGRSADSWRSVDYTQMIQAIQGEFGTIDGVEGNLVGEMIDPDLLPTLRNLEEKSKGKMLMEMNSQELNDLYQALSSITTMARNVDNARVASVKKKISVMAEDFIGNLQTQKDAPLRPKGIQKVTDFLSYNMMDPQRYFDNAERLGGETGRTIWNILRHDGLDTQIRLTEELKKIMAEKIGGFDYKTWASGNKQRVTTFDLSNGSQITLTDGAIMDLYNLNKRQQGRQHIYGINGHGGGIVMGRTQVGTKVYQTMQPVHVSVEDVNNIISALSDEQKKCADTLMEIVNQWGGKLGNEVSNALYGYSKFREDNYWTIHTIQDQHGVKGTDMEQASKADNLYAVLNMGMTKELNKFANNPVQLGNAFDVALDHLANMITYRSWGAPLMDVTRMMNYKSENGIVMREMNRTMGKAGSEYLVQLLRNINGLTNDPIEQKASAFTKMFKNFKAAAVGWNLSTIAKQGLSIVRAFDVVPSHYFLTARQLTERFKKDGEGKKVDGLMEKYAPIYSWKQDGRFTMDTGKDLRSIMLPKTETAVNRFTEFGMKGAGAADNMTWRSIWLATENMIERTTDLQRGTEEFYRAVGDKFTECIDRTQVVDSILHRAEIMRSNSQYVKLGTSFMGEPLKTWNMAADAIRAFVKDKNTVNGKRLIKTSFIMLASAALQATVASVISGLRHWKDDEPLEETIRKYLLGDYDESKGWYVNAIEMLFGNNLANELNPINYIPFARDVSDIVQGHDVTRDDMESLSKLWKAFTNLANDSGKASDQKKIVEFVGAFADLVGVPASNIFKEIGYVSNWGSRALEQAGLNTLGIQYVNMQYDLEMGNKDNLGSYAAFLDAVEKAAEEGRCEKEFAERVRADLIAAGYSEDTINEKIGKRRIGDVSDATTKGGYYKDLVDAIRTGDKEKEDTIRKNLALMGTTAKAIDDGVKDALAEEDDILKAAQAQVDARAGVHGQYKIYEDTVRKYDGQGFDHDTIIKAVNKAVNRIEDEGKKESSGAEKKAGAETAGTDEKTSSVYGDSLGYEYKDLTNAVLNGLADVGEILEDLRKQDKKDQSIRSEVTKKVKPVWVDLMNSGDAEDRREADRIKQQLIDLGIGYDEKDLMRWLK